jgi:hypothetical protein
MTPFCVRRSKVVQWKARVIAGFRIGRCTVDTKAKSLEQLVRELPPDIAAEVRDYVEFLLSKRERGAGKPLRQDWAGALRDYRQQYTSVELQHRSLEWWSD